MLPAKLISFRFLPCPWSNSWLWSSASSINETITGLQCKYFSCGLNIFTTLGQIHTVFSALGERRFGNKGAIIFYREGGSLFVGGPEFFWVVKGGIRTF